LADTAAQDRGLGYLTRRLVDVAQDVIIGDIDCARSMAFTSKELSSRRDH